MSTRRIVVTFDDLPVSHGQEGRGELLDTYRRLLRALAADRVPATGFVNEGSAPRDVLTEILRMWLDAGGELGNHTFSHLYFYETTPSAYQEDVIRGEAVTSALLRERGRRLRYFRHPYLSTGPSAAAKGEFEAFLGGRGYEVAPVTVDNMEWVFSTAYNRAASRGDEPAGRLVGELYLRYMEEVVAFYEKFSADLLGYEIPQILLLHVSALNAEYFGGLSAMMKGRGYAFVPLEEALRDQAYGLPDSYIGPVGISWLQRWAITRGEAYRKEPALPAYIKQFDDARESGSSYKAD